MAPEARGLVRRTEENPYRKTRFIVVGGRGQVGSQVINIIEGLGPSRPAEVCEKEDSLGDSLKRPGRSRVFFFATNGETAAQLIEENESKFKPGDIVIDNSSIKTELIPVYERLDGKGVSAAGVHIGRAPNQPLRGTPVWICSVGASSRKAIELARVMFSSTESDMSFIDIRSHHLIEARQNHTMFDALYDAVAMQEEGVAMEEGIEYATLNTQLRMESTARTLGQKPELIGEIVANPELAMNKIAQYQRALDRLTEAVMGGKGSTAELAREIFEYHNGNNTVVKLYDEAGRLGTIDANLRLPRVSVRITDNHPGYVQSLLDAFSGVDITGINTVSDALTPLEQSRHVSPDKVAVVHIQIDPRTLSLETQRNIFTRVARLGHRIVDFQLS